LATEEQLQEMEKTLEKELDAAVEFAENSPLLEPEEAATDVYAEISAAVDKTGQTSPTEATPEQDLVRKYWEETSQ
jgi:TPP-dependent pyruvate/acetoin dehydrogenase alpha subunit